MLSVGVASSLLVLVASADIPQDVADAVSAASYESILTTELYTHLGDNKGIAGAEHDLCRDAIKARLESYGLAVELDPFDYGGRTNHNVVGTQLGTVNPDAYYIVSAHYDTVNNPGVDDDASGVAAFLEIARVLSGYQTDVSIKYIGWDREEQGLHGSTHYAAAHTADQILGVIQLDMIAADHGLNLQDLWTGSGAADPVALRTGVSQAVTQYGNGTSSNWAGAAGFSDHQPFAARGFPAIAFVEDRYNLNTCYHQPCDGQEGPTTLDYAYAANLTRAIAAYLADVTNASAPCVTDLDGDGTTGGSDLAVLLASWGSAGSADFNGDGTTDGSDLAVLLAAWGGC